MTFEDWLFEASGFNNPPYQGQWKFLHILTLVICVSLIIGFYFIGFAGFPTTTQLASTI